MDDRTLLEMAAKAADVRGNYEPFGIRRPAWPWLWNPLSEDGAGDTLRLAEKLGINIDFADQCAWKRLGDGSLIQEFWGGDYPPCYRHAIVRAAAEIELAKSPVSAPGAVEDFI